MISEKDLISIEYRDVSFEFEQQNKTIDWLLKVAQLEHKSLDQIQYTFCSDQELLLINQKYLNHDDYTDIITFPYDYDPIQSEIFISIDRVKENAILHKQNFDRELRRVMVHGLLHMCGYGDKSPIEKKEMRSKEDEYLALFKA